MAIIIKSHKDTLLIDSTIGINYNSVVMYFREKKICMNVLYEIVKQVL